MAGLPNPAVPTPTRPFSSSSSTTTSQVRPGREARRRGAARVHEALEHGQRRPDRAALDPSAPAVAGPPRSRRACATRAPSSDAAPLRSVPAGMRPTSREPWSDKSSMLLVREWKGRWIARRLTSWSDKDKLCAMAETTSTHRAAARPPRGRAARDGRLQPDADLHRRSADHGRGRRDHGSRTTRAAATSTASPGVFAVSLGHGNDEIIDAIVAQHRRLSFSSPIMTTTDRALELADRADPASRAAATTSSSSSAAGRRRPRRR